MLGGSHLQFLIFGKKYFLRGKFFTCEVRPLNFCFGRQKVQAFVAFQACFWSTMKMMLALKWKNKSDSPFYWLCPMFSSVCKQEHCWTLHKLERLHCSCGDNDRYQLQQPTSLEKIENIIEHEPSSLLLLPILSILDCKQGAVIILDAIKRHIYKRKD